MRVFGVISCCLSTFFLFMCLLVSLLAWKEGGFLFMLVLFSTPSMLFLGLGVALWGRKRWIVVTGWVLTITSGFGALYGFMIWVMMQTAYWQQMTTGLDASILEPFVSASFVSIPFGLIGAAMVYYQWEEDKVLLNTLSTSGSHADLSNGSARPLTSRDKGAGGF